MPFLRILIMLFMLVSSMAWTQVTKDVSDLPIRAFPVVKKQEVLFIYFTGDGGWNNFSQELVEKIRSMGYPILAFDSRKYFWDAKTPEKFSADVQRMMEYYLSNWKLDKVAIVGYSFGADVAAFLPSHLPKKTIEHLLPMVLLSPSYSSDFEVKFSDLIGSGTKAEKKYNVQKELTSSTINILCIFGEDEELYLKESLRSSHKIKIKEIPGSHRYDNNVELLSELIMAQTTK